MVSGSNMEDVFLPSILVGREKEGGMKGGKKQRERGRMHIVQTS